MKALKFRFSWAALVAALPGFAFAAEFPVAVNGVLTLDVSESETYDRPLPSGVHKLVKTGSGEAVLTVATTAFDGSVDVQAGTLTLKDAVAVGSNTKIAVTGDAATLHLNFANPGGWDTVFFAGHDITICGKGADGKGAFRYTDSGSGNNDNMLDSLTLSGDASIAVPSRFGISAALNLNGHTLTRADGGASWMLRSGTTLTIGGGTICNRTGVIAWQNDPVFTDPENTVLRMEGGTLEAHGAKELNCKVEFAGGAFKGMWRGGNSLAQSVSVQKETTISQNDSTYVTRIAGAVDATADVVLTGKGLHYFDGRFTSTGSVWFQGGVTFIGADFSVGNMLRLCGAGKVSEPCAVYQTAGDFKSTDPNGWIVRIGQADNTYSAYVVSGGTAEFAGLLNIGSGAGSSAFVLADGGAIRATNGVITATSDNGGVASRSIIRVSGGGRFQAAGDDAYDRNKVTQLANGDGATGVLVVTGEGSIYETGKLILGPESGVATTRVVVSDGGVLKTGRLYGENDADASAGSVYFDGGVLKPTFWASWAENYLNADKSAPSQWELGERGMTVDMTDLKAESANVEVTEKSELIIKSNLSDATGRGIASITLPTDNEAYAKEAYCGPAFVEIERPEGSHGAVAVAECDPATRKLTGVSILAPGSGYDETTKVFVRSADGQSRYECACTLTEADRVGGKLVKRGKSTLGLSGINTYTGGTTVEEGSLKIRGDRSFPENTPLAVRTGATLDAEGKNLTVSTLAVSGGGTVNCETLTVTEGLELSVADIFAADAKAMTISGRLILEEGATVTITDPENLADHFNDERRIILSAAGGVAGTAPALEGKVGEKWSLSLAKSGDALVFGPRRGFHIIIR